MSTLKLVRNISLCALLVPLAACVDPDERADATQSALIFPPMMNTRPATFKCDDSGVVVVRPIGEDGAAITLAFRSKDVKLNSVPASEGRKYSDGNTTFWMNGPNATLLASAQGEPETCEQR